MTRTIRRAAQTAATLTAAVAVGLVFAGPAQASFYVPNNNDLCRASENIYFYSSPYSNHTFYYTVQAGEYIRVDFRLPGGSVWAQGHGEGHSTGYFVWQHSDGSSRVWDCHQGTPA